MKNEWAKEKEEIKGELREGQLEELKEKLALFVGGLSDAQRSQFEALQYELGLARRYIRSAQLELASLNNFDEAHSSEPISENRFEVMEGSEAYNRAVVEIERKAHQHSGGIGDVLKSLFMWKDSPEEHLKS